jgi:hypothetical protein
MRTFAFAQFGAATRENELGHPDKEALLTLCGTLPISFTTEVTRSSCLAHGDMREIL